jgi:hypothetical protein
VHPCTRPLRAPRPLFRQLLHALLYLPTSLWVARRGSRSPLPAGLYLPRPCSRTSSIHGVVSSRGITTSMYGTALVHPCTAHRARPGVVREHLIEPEARCPRLARLASCAQYASGSRAFLWVAALHIHALTRHSYVLVHHRGGAPSKFGMAL